MRTNCFDFAKRQEQVPPLVRDEAKRTPATVELIGDCEDNGVYLLTQTNTIGGLRGGRSTVMG